MSSETSPLSSEAVAPAQPEVATSIPLEPALLERVEGEIAHKIIAAIKSERHSGPMPSAKQFKEYDEALPGTALAIREEFQANGKHIRGLEERGQMALIENDRCNRQTAERLVWASLLLILVLSLFGHENVAIAVSVTTVAAVITGFLSKKNVSKKPSDQLPEGE